ncbi:unnamed protein product [Lota lota]
MELDSDMSLYLIDSNDKKPRLESCLMTLHCNQCNTVVGDSQSVCGEFKSMKSIMIVRVTDSVSLSDHTESKMERESNNCLHRSLECSSCHCILGAVVESTPLHLEMLRSVFLLQKEKINCYILEQSKMVKASDLVFDQKPISESIHEAIKLFRAQCDQMTQLHNRLCVNKCL